jgi:SAM-dependent methyltransferase
MIYFDPDISEKAKIAYHSRAYYVAPSPDKISGYPDYCDQKHLESKQYFGEIVLSWIRKQAPEAKSILDVGCAVGAMSVPFQKAGWKVVGIDVSAWAINWGLKHFKDLDLRCCELSAIRGRFDVILFWDVFEHINRPQEVLSCAKKLLNPGGIIVFQVPDVEGFIDNPEHSLWSTYQHSCFYTRETFGKLMDVAGLQIVRKIPSTQEYEMVFIVGKGKK